MRKRRTSCKKATKLEWHSIQLLQRKGQQAKPARSRSKSSRERQGKAQRYSLPHRIHLSWWEYRQTSRLVWWERWGNLKAARWEACTDKAQREAGHLLSKKWDSTLLSTWTATTFDTPMMPWRPSMDLSPLAHHYYLELTGHLYSLRRIPSWSHEWNITTVS